MHKPALGFAISIDLHKCDVTKVWSRLVSLPEQQLSLVISLWWVKSCTIVLLIFVSAIFVIYQRSWSIYISHQITLQMFLHGNNMHFYDWFYLYSDRIEVSQWFPGEIDSHACGMSMLLNVSLHVTTAVFLIFFSRFEQKHRDWLGCSFT